jgi:hypothetical protein
VCTAVGDLSGVDSLEQSQLSSTLHKSGADSDPEQRPRITVGKVAPQASTASGALHSAHASSSHTRSLTLQALAHTALEGSLGQLPKISLYVAHGVSHSAGMRARSKAPCAVDCDCESWRAARARSTAPATR